MADKYWPERNEDNARVIVMRDAVIDVIYQRSGDISVYTYLIKKPRPESEPMSYFEPLGVPTCYYGDGVDHHDGSYDNELDARCHVIELAKLFDDFTPGGSDG
jgi:hypothetical protein